MKRFVLLCVTLGLYGSSCAVRSVSNARRVVYRLDSPEQGVERKVFCPEPVGPATKLNSTSLTVKANSVDLEGSLSNAQELGTIYQLSDIIQYSQYALFMNCMGWANGAITGDDFMDINSTLHENTADLIRARIDSEKLVLLAALEQAQKKVEEAEEAKAKAEADKKEAEAKAADAKATVEEKNAASAATAAADEKAKDAEEKLQKAQGALRNLQGVIGVTPDKPEDQSDGGEEDPARGKPDPGGKLPGKK
jgi:hypothetical protein